MGKAAETHASPVGPPSLPPLVIAITTNWRPFPPVFVGARCRERVSAAQRSLLVSTEDAHLGLSLVAEPCVRPQPSQPRPRNSPCRSWAGWQRDWRVAAFISRSINELPVGDDRGTGGCFHSGPETIFKAGVSQVAGNSLRGVPRPRLNPHDNFVYKSANGHFPMAGKVMWSWRENDRTFLTCPLRHDPHFSDCDRAGRHSENQRQNYSRPHENGPALAL